MLKLRNLGDVNTEVKNSVGVSPFVIIPRNNLDEVGIQGDTSLSIENGAVSISNEVRADNFIFSVSKNSLKN